MLVITPECRKAFQEAQEHAGKLRISDQFEMMLNRLNLMCCRWENLQLARTLLSVDGAPYSFFWSTFGAKVTGVDDLGIPVPEEDIAGNIVYDTDSPRLIGGLIFHPGATGPDKSMSVEIDPSSQPHWSIHT